MGKNVLPVENPDAAPNKGKLRTPGIFLLRSRYSMSLHSVQPKLYFFHVLHPFIKIESICFQLMNNGLINELYGESKLTSSNFSDFAVTLVSPVIFLRNRNVLCQKQFKHTNHRLDIVLLCQALEGA